MSKPKLKVKTIDLTELVEKLGGKRKSSGILEALGDDVPSEVLDALATIIEGAESAEGGIGSKFANVTESQAELTKYHAMPMPHVGALVERSEFGKERYNCPDEEKHEAAIVLEVWPHYMPDGDDGNAVANGVIGVSNRKGIVRTYAVDLRCFQEVTAAKAGTTH